jgi:hypothetical protein
MIENENETRDAIEATIEELRSERYAKSNERDARDDDVDAISESIVDEETYVANVAKLSNVERFDVESSIASKRVERELASRASDDLSREIRALDEEIEEKVAYLATLASVERDVASYVEETLDDDALARVARASLDDAKSEESDDAFDREESDEERATREEIEREENESKIDYRDLDAFDRAFDRSDALDVLASELDALRDREIDEELALSRSLAIVYDVVKSARVEATNATNVARRVARDRFDVEREVSKRSRVEALDLALSIFESVYASYEYSRYAIDFERVYVALATIRDFEIENERDDDEATLSLEESDALASSIVSKSAYENATTREERDARSLARRDAIANDAKRREIDSTLEETRAKIDEARKRSIAFARESERAFENETSDALSTFDVEEYARDEARYDAYIVSLATRVVETFDDDALDYDIFAFVARSLDVVDVESARENEASEEYLVSRETFVSVASDVVRVSISLVYDEALEENEARDVEAIVARKIEEREREEFARSFEFVDSLSKIERDYYDAFERDYYERYGANEYVTTSSDDILGRVVYVDDDRDETTTREERENETTTRVYFERDSFAKLVSETTTKNDSTTLDEARALISKLEASVALVSKSDDDEALDATRDESEYVVVENDDARSYDVVARDSIAKRATRSFDDDDDDESENVANNDAIATYAKENDVSLASAIETFDVVEEIVANDDRVSDALATSVAREELREREIDFDDEALSKLVDEAIAKRDATTYETKRESARDVATRALEVASDEEREVAIEIEAKIENARDVERTKLARDRALDRLDALTSAREVVYERQFELDESEERDAYALVLDDLESALDEARDDVDAKRERLASLYFVETNDDDAKSDDAKASDALEAIERENAKIDEETKRDDDATRESASTSFARAIASANVEYAYDVAFDNAIDFENDDDVAIDVEALIDDLEVVVYEASREIENEYERDVVREVVVEYVETIRALNATSTTSEETKSASSVSLRDFDDALRIENDEERVAKLTSFASRSKSKSDRKSASDEVVREYVAKALDDLYASEIESAIASELDANDYESDEARRIAKREALVSAIVDTSSLALYDANYDVDEIEENDALERFAREIV